MRVLCNMKGREKANKTCSCSNSRGEISVLPFFNPLRWLNTVFHKMENSRFRLVFLNCYFLMSNKEYRTDVKHCPKGSNLFTEATQLSLLWQR